MQVSEQQRWQRVRDIFAIASDAGSDDRQEIVHTLCGSDTALRAEVETLLALRNEHGLALDKLPLTPAAQEQILAAAPVVSRFRPGDLIGGRYRISRFLARGGMGEVYEAHTLDGLPVALKFVRNLRNYDHRVTARFLREVRMAGRIEHPNVCRVLDVAEHDDVYFCAMELLVGETLAARLERCGKLSPSQALPLALQLCDGLDAAHQAGVIHRDLKPSNIFLAASDRVVIIDFGLAAAATKAPGDESLTATGAVIGTLAYMAPEQLEENGDTPASDIYSFGVILYEMLTGQKPHDAKSPFRLAAQKAREAHRVLTGPAAAPLPAACREIITRSLKANPHDRYPTVAAMKRALERGRPTLRFFLQQPRAFVPLALVILALAGWVGARWAAHDHVPPPEAAQLYTGAYQAMTQSSPMRAVQSLEKAIVIDPRFINAHSLLAIAYLEIDQSDKAKDALLAAMALKDQRWLLGRGETHALNAASAAVVSDVRTAIHQYAQLAAIDGNRDFALLSQARMQQRAGLFDEAIHTLESAIAAGLGPTAIPAARVRLAGLYARKGDYARASAQYTQAEAGYRSQENDEGLADVLIARGSSLQSQTTWQSRLDLQHAAELGSKSGNLYQNLKARLLMVRLHERELDYDAAIAVARNVAADAEAAGMQMLDAEATAELGYAHMFAKQVDKAQPILRHAVELAERAKSYSLLNSTRMRWADVLAAQGDHQQALPLLEQIVAWHRRGGGSTSLPLVLAKLGSALFSTSRFHEAPAAYQEGYELARRSGDPLLQSMNLSRLVAYFSSRDLQKADEYSETLLRLRNDTLLAGFYFILAAAARERGDTAAALQLIDEGERQAVEKIKDGVDRRYYLAKAANSRAELALQQGRCAEAVGLFKSIRQAPEGVVSIDRFHRAQVCAGTGGLSLAKANLAWYQAQFADARKPADTIADFAVGSGQIALHLKDWKAARHSAERGIAASRGRGNSLKELENSLILRVVESKQGHPSEVNRLTGRIRQLARDIRFPEPERFANRPDLLYFWNLVP